MSVQIDTRRYCPTSKAARPAAASSVVPWAIVCLMASYIGGSALFASPSHQGDLASLDRPAAIAGSRLQRAGETATRSGGQVAVYGQVRNTSRRALTDVEAVVELYDASGRLVSVGHGLATERRIEPGATTSYEAYADDRDDIAGYRLRFRRLGGGSL